MPRPKRPDAGDRFLKIAAAKRAKQSKADHIFAAIAYRVPGRQPSLCRVQWLDSSPGKFWDLPPRQFQAELDKRRREARADHLKIKQMKMQLEAAE